MKRKDYFIKTDKIIVRKEDVKGIHYVKEVNADYQIVTVRNNSILVICTTKNRKDNRKQRELGVSKAYNLYDMDKKDLNSNLIYNLKKLAFFRAIKNNANIDYFERYIQDMLISEVKARYKNKLIPNDTYVVYDKGLWKLIGNTMYSANELIGLKKRNSFEVNQINQEVTPITSSLFANQFNVDKTEIMTDIFNAIKGCE